MRTPKQKKSAPKTKRGGGGATDKLRKKAMKSKMMKKTLLAVGGDQTREDVRDLMNDSELSVCVAKDSIEPDMGQTDQDLVLKLSPEKPKTKASTMTAMKKSLSIVSMKTKETTEELTNGILKRTRSLRNSRSKRKLSNEENIDFTLATSEKKKKVDEPETVEEKAHPASGLTLSEQTMSKFAGVKNLLTNAVWGVPYAKVVEDLDISACEPELEQSLQDRPKADANCVIS